MKDSDRYENTNLLKAVEDAAHKDFTQTSIEWIGAGVNHIIQGYQQELAQKDQEILAMQAQIEGLKALLAQNQIALPAHLKDIQPQTPASPARKQKTFTDLIQVQNVQDVLLRLHRCIDGKGGKDVAAVLLRAIADKLIMRRPTEMEFRQEFTNISSTWHTIGHYLNPNTFIDISAVVI